MNAPLPPDEQNVRNVQDAFDALLARIEVLRQQGAQQAAPTRFHHIETLSRRAQQHEGPVRDLLQNKLEAAVSACAELAAGRAVAMQQSPKARRAPAAGPLAQLLPLLQGMPSGTRGPASPAIQVRHELPSVDRFRRAWSSSRALDQVEQGAARIPANAGPLNSHALVLQTLALMQELSPDYLARFIGYVESLQWLERAVRTLPQASDKGGKASRKARSRK